MQVKQLIAVAAILIAAGPASAQQSEYIVADADFVPGKTRAEVMAEVLQAQADGNLVVRDGQYPVLSAGSQRSRDEVRAEARQAAQDRSRSNLYFGS
ncbi:MAG TPA: DUF4148 domain-containing protein [Burkholderiaceae bacterium]|nr:DUF4148 domain-containing protein [Burkholderiaceae bacterium]